jgi:hypothetical protein
MTETFYPDDIETDDYVETEREETEQVERVEKRSRREREREHARIDYAALQRVARNAGINQLWARVATDYLKYASGNVMEEARIVAALRETQPQMFRPDPPTPKALPIRGRR